MSSLPGCYWKFLFLQSKADSNMRGGVKRSLAALHCGPGVAWAAPRHNAAEARSHRGAWRHPILSCLPPLRGPFLQGGLPAAGYEAPHEEAGSRASSAAHQQQKQCRGVSGKIGSRRASLQLLLPTGRQGDQQQSEDCTFCCPHMSGRTGSRASLLARRIMPRLLLPPCGWENRQRHESPHGEDHAAAFATHTQAEEGGEARERG